MKRAESSIWRSYFIKQPFYLINKIISPSCVHRVTWDDLYLPFTLVIMQTSQRILVLTKCSLNCWIFMVIIMIMWASHRLLVLTKLILNYCIFMNIMCICSNVFQHMCTHTNYMQNLIKLFLIIKVLVRLVVQHFQQEGILCEEKGFVVNHDHWFYLQFINQYIINYNRLSHSDQLLPKLCNLYNWPYTVKPIYSNPCLQWPPVPSDLSRILPNHFPLIWTCLEWPPL